MRSLTLLCLVGLGASAAQGARLKDLMSLKGTRDNQLLGYGLVVGLAGTGDKSSELTSSSLGLALKGLGVDHKIQKIETKNVAAVVVSAVLPPFAKAGSKLDVTVSSVGSATSLDGGALVATSLRAPDGKVYAMAQGKILTTKRSDNARVGGQTVVTAAVPDGAILEKEVAFDLQSQKELRYHLIQADFTTAARIARRINEELGGKYAIASDAATVDVILPYQYEGTAVDLVAQIEAVDVEADRKAKIVVNQRTGTVVLGDNVRLAPVAVAHGNLKIEVRDNAKVAAGVPVDDAVKTQTVMTLQPGPSIAEVASSLNEIGASAEDLVALIRALRASGALLAEVEVQ